MDIIIEEYNKSFEYWKTQEVEEVFVLNPMKIING
jgi:saccharopine dehydrogenase-like NADP-dependent oxidoreductase